MTETARMDGIETWIFDLDNTLYAASEAMVAETDRLLGSLVAEFLNVDAIEARRIQKAYFRRYGLTLRGLMVEHGLDPEHYVAHMMRMDYAALEPAPALAAALGRLNGRRIVYTNAFDRHAEAVLDRLGLAPLFEVVHDIRAAEFLPKPDIAAYRALCARHAIDSGGAVMVDDIVANLAPAAAIGMTTVWLRTTAAWARDAQPEPHCHHVIDDIVAWLDQVAPATAARG